MNSVFLTLQKSDFAVKLALSAGKELHRAGITRFADGEVEITLPPHVEFRGKRVYVVHATCPPVHDHIIQALLMANALHNAGVAEIIAIIPYFGYARHDKSDIAGGRAPVEAIIRALETAEYTKIITVELHAPHIITQFSVPAINISSVQLLADLIKKHGDLNDVCLVAPDKGAVPRVEAVAALLGLPVMHFTKERIGTDQTRIVAQHGQCNGKKAIIVDDMIDSGGTAIGVCNELKNMGFNSIIGYFVHPVLSGNAVQKIEASPFEKIYVSNTIDLKERSPKIEVFDMSTQVTQCLD